MRYTTTHINDDFYCTHCHHLVPTSYLVAGVHNRNHCPYCLWSRHLDLFKAGDRLCACKGAMRPIGLTLKQAGKKYPGKSQGELMLIHRCTDCGDLSINRIAADDDNDLIYEIFERAFQLDRHERQQIADSAIQLLQPADASLVQYRLWGKRINQPQLQMLGMG